MSANHAILSASSANRWLVCTAAPRFEAQFPETTSAYAEEGRLAHSICELKALKKFTASFGPKAFATRMNKLKKEPLYSDEMDRTSEAYLDHLLEKAMAYDTLPLVNVEVRVDFAEYVPEGFGTCDCVMIGGDMLDITDYKHGKGVPVSAEGNPQLRLYALGALRQYEPFYGGVIQRVRMTIDQPRVRDTPSSETLTVEELKAWGESIKPIAEKAFGGFGEFVPGDHCRFCRGKAQCRARAESNTALEDFKDLKAIPGSLANDLIDIGNAAGVEDMPPILTHAEIGDLLERGANLDAWLRDLKEFALGAVLKGEEIPGWKAVAGTSLRKIKDQIAAITALKAAGYDEALLYKAREMVTFGELDKLVGGEKQLKSLLGEIVQKPLGKPTLAPISDKREVYRSAAADFAGVEQEAPNE